MSLYINMNYCPFAKYSNIFGEPNKGVHSYRLFGVAIVDVILTIIGAIVISKIINVNFFLVLVLLFLLGIVLHKLFCVNTTINKLIFS